MKCLLIIIDSAFCFFLVLVLTPLLCTSVFEHYRKSMFDYTKVLSKPQFLLSFVQNLVDIFTSLLLTSNILPHRSVVDLEDYAKRPLVLRVLVCTLGVVTARVRYIPSGSLMSHRITWEEL